MDRILSAKYGSGRMCPGCTRRLGVTTARCLMVFAGIIAGLAGCKKEKTMQVEAPAPPVVMVSKVEQHEVVPYEIRTGTLRANQYVKVYPRVSGFIETINFTPGRLVNVGTVLFTLDNRPFKAKVAEAQASVAMQEANLAYANDELARQEKMIKEGSTSVKELADARNSQKKAVAAVEAAKASLQAAQINLDYCTITSPIKGKVDTNAVDIGDLVGSPGQKPLTTVAEIAPIIVDFTFTESMIVEYMRDRPLDLNRKLSIPVKLSLGTENDFRHDATLDFISNTVDSTTGTLAAQATARNEKLELYPGLFVRVKVDLIPIKNAMLIREDAIGRDIGGDFVWIITPDNTAEKRYIKLGTLVENMRVIQSGLAANETYVAEGMQRVRDRAKVTAKPVKESTTQAVSRG